MSAMHGNDIVQDGHSKDTDELAGLQGSAAGPTEVGASRSPFLSGQEFLRMGPEIYL